MKAVVLGSGQDGGVPQLFGAEQAERTASSVAVLTDRGVILLDCTPDIRTQHRALTKAVGAEAAAVAGIALTHAHMGHYTGLVHFGKEAASADRVPVYATASMARFLSTNEPWASLFRDGHLVASSMHFDVDGVTGEAIPVPHRSEHTDAVAWSVADDDRRLLYLPDIDSWDEWPDAEEVIAGHDVAFLDATFFDIDEPLRRPIGDVPHPLVIDTVDRFASVETRIILTHLNHTNALARGDIAALRTVEEAGFEVAFDGMVIT